MHRLALIVALAALAACARPDRAIDAIDAQRIAGDITYVACDDMGGRDTPSVGQRLTARFIRNRLERLGWTVDFHVYHLTERVLDEGASRATASRGDEKVDLTFGIDYVFAPQQIANLDLEADVVHFGAVPEKLAPEAAAAAKGKWAFFTEPGGSFQEAENILRQAGAAGVLTTVHVIGNLGSDPEGGDVFKLFARIMREGRVERPSKERLLPRVYVKKRVVARLLELSGAQARSIRFSDTRRMKSERQVPCENVLGYWPGRSKETIIVSAHYDHVGTRGANVYNGADDNASGTCGLLALADALTAHGPLERSVLLAWVSGEENGLWGSQAFVDEARLPAGAKPVANVNLDMIGRNAPDSILISPFDPTHAHWSDLARRAHAAAAMEGFAKIESGDPYFERSDQASFVKLGIPVVFFTDGMHADYHATTDDAEKIDADKVRRVARAVFRMLAD